MADTVAHYIPQRLTIKDAWTPDQMDQGR